MANIENPGNTPPSSGNPAIIIIETYLKSNYAFRYNEVIKCVEYSQDNTTFKRLTDRKENTLVLELQRKNIHCSRSLLQLILYSDFSPSYNPIIAFLDSLPAWDQKTDHIKHLADTIKTTDDTLWEFYLRKWLVAMVASWAKNDIINHTVLILCGGQGLGKTTWCRNLIPQDQRAYFYSGSIKPSDKDSMAHLAECMMINLDELGDLNDKTTSAFKELLTKGELKYRVPYGRLNEPFVRIASFVGSVNSREYLSDETGNRRFLTVEVEQIDYDHQIDMRMVYAQALELYKAGFRYWFSAQESKEISERNRQFLEISAEEELLLQHFEPCEMADATDFLMTTDILTIISKGTKIPLTQQSKKKLGKVLRAKGFKPTSRRDRKVWAVKARSGRIEEILNGTGGSLGLN